MRASRAGGPGGGGMLARPAPERTAGGRGAAVTATVTDRAEAARPAQHRPALRRDARRSSSLPSHQEPPPLSECPPLPPAPGRPGGWPVPAPSVPSRFPVASRPATRAHSQASGSPGHARGSAGLARAAPRGARCVARPWPGGRGFAVGSPDVISVPGAGCRGPWVTSLSEAGSPEATVVAEAGSGPSRAGTLMPYRVRPAVESRRVWLFANPVWTFLRGGCGRQATSPTCGLVSRRLRPSGDAGRQWLISVFPRAATPPSRLSSAA